MKSYVCHSGGAEGADFYFESFGKKFNVKTISYSYKTKFHNSEFKYELTDNDFLEGVKKVEIANQTLQRFKYKHVLKFLARNWFQVKNAEEIFAIGVIKERNNNTQIIKGGTGWTVQMAIDSQKKIFVYDQNQMKWFYWNFKTRAFEVCENEPEITKSNFAGIGTRKINLFGIEAIRNLFEKSFNKKALNILYLHGLESKLSLQKREILEVFGNVISPDLDYFNDQKIIENVYEFSRNKNIDVIIGSSFGGFVGFYLSQIMQKQAYLFNPALNVQSIFQEIPDSKLLHKTKITILLGAKDDVVPNKDTLSFLKKYNTQSQLTIKINYEMGHGIPINIFENELSMFLEQIK